MMMSKDLPLLLLLLLLLCVAPASGSEPPACPSQLPTPHPKARRVSCQTTKGPMVMDWRSDWCPLGTPRFLEMVESGFFATPVAFFRTIPGFVAQTGVSGDPEVTAQWQAKGEIKDDKQWMPIVDQKTDFKRGYVAFAGRRPDTRGTEFFIAYQDIALGRSPWEVPCARLVGDDSFATLDHLYAGYWDTAFVKGGGKPPRSGLIYKEGNAYLQDAFPLMDYITSCDLRPAAAEEASASL